MKKILAATDFSEGSRLALDLAVQIGDKFGAKLLLLHVLHDPAEAPGFYTAKKAGKKVFRNLEQAAQSMMEDFVESHLKKYKKHETQVLPGLPSAQIVACAKQEGVDLIVMGTHGRSGLQRLMIGSVADKVIRTASCPVLTVQAPKNDGEKKTKGKKSAKAAKEPHNKAADKTESPQAEAAKGAGTDVPPQDQTGTADARTE